MAGVSQTLPWLRYKQVRCEIKSHSLKRIAELVQRSEDCDRARLSVLQTSHVQLGTGRMVSGGINGDIVVNRQLFVYSL